MRNLDRGEFLKLGLAAGATLLAPGLTKTFADASPEMIVYNPKTGHNMAGNIFNFWHRHRRGELIGSPISEVLPTPEGKFLQYFENCVLEENPDTDQVWLLDLGRKYMHPHHDLSGGPLTLFLPSQYWQKHGGREFFGKPLSGTLPLIKGGLDDGFTQFTENFAFDRLPAITPEPQFDGQDRTYDIYRSFKYPHGLTELTWPGEIVPVHLGRFEAQDQGVATAPSKPHPQAIPLDSPIWDANKKIEVSLTDQTLTAFEEGIPVLKTLTSTGKAGYGTVVGRFTVLKKKEILDYYSPFPESWYQIKQVPYNLLFHRGGYYIHGAYWHQKFGRVQSYGCVNLNLDDAKWVYDWAQEGTAVQVKV